MQDHTLLGSAIAGILAAEPDLTVCGIARTGADAAQVALRDRAAVVLMDFHLPDMSGPDAANLIRTHASGVAIVFHSAEESEAALLDAIDAGAAAFLTKSATADEIVAAVRKAARGEVLIPAGLFAKAIARQHNALADKPAAGRLVAQLTEREREVLGLLAQGLDTMDISHHLGIAAHTVEWHVRHVIEKLGVHSKLQAVIAAARLGLISVERT